MPPPYHERGFLLNRAGQYHLLDARNARAVLSRSRPITLTLTSPPYWNLKDYGVDKQIGFGQRYDAYLDDVSRVFQTVYDHTSPTGTLWIVADSFKHNGHLHLLPFDIADRLRSIGWLLQDVIIWHKDRTLPWSHQGKLRNIFEYVVFFSKTRDFTYHVSDVRDVTDLKDYWVKYPERYSPEGKTPSRAWYFPIPRQGSWGTTENYVKHACPFPPALVERIITLCSNPGDVVFDPFAGSGTTLAVAAGLGRRYIGLDINPAFKTLFESRVFLALQRAYTKPTDSALKAKFSSTVTDLRALKYAKELYRLYTARHGRLNVPAIGVLRSFSDIHYLLAVRLRARQRISLIRDRVVTLSSRPPLSKYGIKARVTIIDSRTRRSRSLPGVNRRATLYVYLNGRFYRWHQRLADTTLHDVLGNFLDKAPPKHPALVSTVNVSLPHRFCQVFGFKGT